MRRALTVLFAVSLALVVAIPSATRSLVWHWEKNPVLRGRLVADEMGCAGCHLPFAGVEIPNPGSRWGTVPRFEAGNVLMYAEDRAEIEEYIRLGAPRAWLDDPEIVERLENQLVRMPAYEDRLSDGEISDLVAWTAAVEGVDLPGGDAGAGRRLARQHGCLSCHGVEGSGGLANPGSLAGFIPGFAGRNFEHLVKDEDEFREWIREGTSSRLEANPLVRWLWQNQEIAMPAYGEEISDAELSKLWAWVQALRSADG